MECNTRFKFSTIKVGIKLESECCVQQAKQLIVRLIVRQHERRADEEIKVGPGCTNLNSDDLQRLGIINNTPKSAGSAGNCNRPNRGSSNCIHG